jgi:hypothetical protein
LELATIRLYIRLLVQKNEIAFVRLDNLLVKLFPTIDWQRVVKKSRKPPNSFDYFYPPAGRREELTVPGSAFDFDSFSRYKQPFPPLAPAVTTLRALDNSAAIFKSTFTFLWPNSTVALLEDSLKTFYGILNNLLLQVQLYLEKGLVNIKKIPRIINDLIAEILDAPINACHNEQRSCLNFLDAMTIFLVSTCNACKLLY